MKGIYFLTVQGVSLTSEASEFLFYVACWMLNGLVKRTTVRLFAYEADIKTDFEDVLLGNIFGIKFAADVKIGNDKGHAEFIVHERDIEWLRDVMRRGSQLAHGNRSRLAASCN